MADHAHEVQTAVASESGDGGVLGGVLQQPLERGRLLSDLAQEQGAGRWLGQPVGERAHPASRSTNTGTAPARSRRLSSVTRR